MSNEKHTCTTLVYSSWSIRWGGCGKPAKVERNGRWYCGIHDPVKLAAKRAERDAKYERWATRREWDLKLQSLREDIVYAVLLHGDVDAAVAAYRAHEAHKPEDEKP